jgi:thiamine-phosphate pyrophosphorylase
MRLTNTYQKNSAGTSYSFKPPRMIREDEISKRLLLYLVVDPEQAAADLTETVKAALAGGVTAVQLRSKSLTDRETIRIGESIARQCEAADSLFLVNDRLDLALALNAAGVHLGVDDLPVPTARALVRRPFVVGYSPESDEQTAHARQRGADYLGVGPVYITGSKADAGTPIGIETIARRSTLAGIPIVGIGGVLATNARQVVEAGAVGVAVMSAILDAADPFTAATALRKAVEGLALGS